jgi:hypothetical protein
MKQRPVVIGLMLCEQVIVEENTRNITPVNCFNHRTFDSFPSEKNPFIVFALLTDGSGEMRLEVVIQRLDTLDEIYRSQLVRFPNPLQDLRCTIRIRDCSFPVAGHYQVVLFFDNEMTAQRKFVVLKREMTP